MKLSVLLVTFAATTFVVWLSLATSSLLQN